MHFARSVQSDDRLISSHTAVARFSAEFDLLSQFLPPIIVGDWIRRFPLFHATSVRLANVLLADSTANVSQLASALCEDPALCLWALSERQSRGLEAARSLDEVAADLAPRLLSLLTERANAGFGDAQSPGADYAAAPTWPTASSEWPSGTFELLALSYRQWFSLCSTGQEADAESFAHWLQPAVAGFFPWELAAETAASKPKRRSRAKRPPSFQDDQAPCVDLAQLAKTLVTIQNLQSDCAQALAQAKLESLKEFAYGAGHEINNPLANISARAQTLLQEETDPDRRRRLAAINTQAFRAHEMIADMMLYARPPALQLGDVDLVEVVKAAIAGMQAQADDQQTALRLAGASACRIRADKVQLTVAVRSLVANALESLGQGGQVEIEVQIDADDLKRFTGAAASAAVIVRDTGPGVSAAAAAHLFDPFYSGREAGRGLGFGLPKCWSIARLHGGTIVLDTAPQSGGTATGATFRLRLPIAGPTTDHSAKLT